MATDDDLDSAGENYVAPRHALLATLGAWAIIGYAFFAMMIAGPWLIWKWLH